MSKKRVLLLEFRQESNTFNPIVMPRETFNGGSPFEGEAILKAKLRSHEQVCGVVDTLENAGFEVIASALAAAPSGGRVADAMLEHVKERVAEYIRKENPDAVCACLHGATCTETIDDACGSLLAHIRKLVGDKPITVNFDLHANVTDQVLENADFVSGYQTYPHHDLYEAGCRSAQRCIEMLKGEKNYMATVKLPVLLPPAGYTDTEGAFKGVMDYAKELVTKGVLKDFNIFVVQPWLDIDTIASRVIAVASDPETAKAYAAELAEKFYAIRGDMWPELTEVDDIIRFARENTSGKPVILADSADSPNGGCVGDSPVAAMKLLEAGDLSACTFIRDPKTVEQAFAVGVGNSAEFSVGAGYTADMPGPLKATGYVRSLHDGHFSTGNSHAYLGKAAVIRFGKVDVLVSTGTAHSGLPWLYRQFGMEPSFYDVVVVKANTSFRRYYAPITDLIYVADTPGAGASNLHQFRWKNLPKGMYPFDLPADYTIEAPKLW